MKVDWLFFIQAILRTERILVASFLLGAAFPVQPLRQREVLRPGGTPRRRLLLPRRQRRGLLRHARVLPLAGIAGRRFREHEDQSPQQEERRAWARCHAATRGEGRRRQGDRHVQEEAAASSAATATAEGTRARAGSWRPQGGAPKTGRLRLPPGLLGGRGHGLLR